MVKRIAHTLVCDKCDKKGQTIYADEGWHPKVEQVHMCEGGKRRRLRNFRLEA